jgi:hypothetical protein
MAFSDLAETMWKLVMALGVVFGGLLLVNTVQGIRLTELQLLYLVFMFLLGGYLQLVSKVADIEKMVKKKGRK